MTTTLTKLYEELDAFNATLNDENEDTPELLAEQERLLNAVTAAEAADLPSLSVKQLTHHFQKRAPGQSLPKGLSKATFIKRIEALPPLPTPEADFTVAGWAKANGKDGREVRKALRAAGLKAPYTPGASHCGAEMSGVIDTGMTTENTRIIWIWDVEYRFWIEIKLENAVEAARAAYRKVKAEKCT